MTTFQRQLKLKTNKSFDIIDYGKDGAFQEPRVKGKDKKLRSKYQRTLEKRSLQRELKEV
ncbi:hypothetical protein HXA34_20145 [Salipaludibacillus agaradhaerens]|jgi:hypothetical protein|uniref:hypothetical protein n=1 Tax=Salipaludibacillus agaradhaerens TaxID=76935 RepID=UPI002151F363|nr:hypothetical protein [Salipaludibacillus agaradhaerens]MCR6108603.1 hypothetical protein [Salipaludibacillus agaradhaerens]MCR6120632.1 hypothetical protein [Salipaludibacillus agaradhaerens]